MGSGGNRSFNYDAADRLTSVLKMGGNESYGYDAVGNRSTSHLSGTYSYQSFNKLIGMSQLGRFISEDPIGFAGGDMNLYAYVANSPINFIDPLGLELEWWRLRQPSSCPQPPETRPGYSQTLFGDGGVFTGPTFEEFISAKERARRPCKRFGERFWESFTETNRFLAGLLAPSGTGVLTSKKLAEISAEPTPFRWVRDGFRAASTGAGCGDARKF